MSRRRRVAVVSPQTRLAPARRSADGRRVALPTDFDVRSARRAYVVQRRTAAATLLALAGLLMVLPLLLALLPALNRTRVADIPLAWLLVGAAVYPALFGLALLFLRNAERAERAGPPR